MINEITSLEEKLATNWEKIKAAIEILKNDENKLGICSFESRDEFWKLVQLEKQSDKLEGPLRRWYGHMKYRDSLGQQRSKLLSRLEHVERSEVRRLGDHPKAKPQRWQTPKQRNAQKRDVKAQDPVLEIGGTGGSKASVHPSPEICLKGLPSAVSSRAFSYKSDPENHRGKGHAVAEEKARKKKQMEENFEGGKGEGGKERLSNTEVHRNETGRSDDDEEEDDSDNTTEFILSRPTVHRNISRMQR